MLHGMSVNAAPATLTLGDIYPGAAQEMMVATTTEKANPSVPAAGTGATAAATAVITGATGLPPVIVWVMAMVGLLVVAKVVTEKVTK